MTAKKAFLIGLVVLLALFGVPMLMPGMTMGQCHDCTLAPSCATCVPAVLTIAVGLAFALAYRDVQARRTRAQLLLLAFAFERPPQAS